MEVYKIILIIFLVILLIYILSNVFFSSNIVYDKMCEANEQASENSETNIITDFPDNNTSNFMLSVWFYIDDFENGIGNEKNILFMSSSSNASTVEDFLNSSSVGISQKECKTYDSDSSYKNLSISLGDYTNNLYIDIETVGDSESTYSDNSSCFTRYLIKNVSVQKWNCLTLSIDTKILDVYMDGKLRNSFILPNIYKSSSETDKKIYLGYIGSNAMGFEGIITRVRYEANSINPQTAYEIYKEGINASAANTLYNKYSMKVSFLEYNTEKGSFTI